MFGFDYLLGTHSVEGEQREEVKIVAAKCHYTKCVFAHVIPQKGIDSKLYVVDRLKRDVLWLGHNKIILKSDNEKAIVALLTTILKALRIEHLENTQQAHPAAYDSASNATTEATCKQVAGMVRTTKACLEDRIKQRILVTHCIFYWLVEHAAWLLTVRTTQSDGITAYKRLKGKNFSIPMLGFGEMCLYKLSKYAVKKEPDGKMSARWKEEAFLGYSKDSNEFILWDITEKTITRARSVQRLSESNRWKADVVVAVNRRPQDTLYRAAAQPTYRGAPEEAFE